MFYVDLNTLWLHAFRNAMKNHPNDQLHKIAVSMEYPMAKVDYPGLWVTTSTDGSVRSVGIGHEEVTEDMETGRIRRLRRWTFSGSVEITVGALTSLERGRIIDGLVNTIAMGQDSLNPFSIRDYVDKSERIGLRTRWDSVNVGGFAESPGTPWGTDDLIYEATMTIFYEGEVVIDPSDGELVPLTGFEFDERRADEPDPSLLPPEDEPLQAVGEPVAQDLTGWR